VDTLKYECEIFMYNLIGKGKIKNLFKDLQNNKINGIIALAATILFFFFFFIFTKKTHWWFLSRVTSFRNYNLCQRWMCVSVLLFTISSLYSHKIIWNREPDSSRVCTIPDHRYKIQSLVTLTNVYFFEGRGKKKNGGR